jgi:hypothetical protein
MSGMTEARRVADALLYEGYLLYPYRASAAKNQVRWQYGVLGPLGAAEAGVGEDPELQTECLLEDHGDLRLDVQLRFLHVQSRTVEVAAHEVDLLQVGPASWVPWHEAVEEQVDVRDEALQGLFDGRTIVIEVPGGQDIEALRDEAGQLVGRLVRNRWPLHGRLELSAQRIPDLPLLRLRARVVNTAVWEDLEDEGSTARDIAARTSFVSTHLLLTVRRGSFVSLADPPAVAAEAAAACENRRCWPVLLGDEQDHDLVLASPIILDDHPAVAPESPGDLFDCTEIDEILTLRILTMTDEEKAAARGTDPRAATILDRCEALPPEAMAQLHGGTRGDDAHPADADEPWWDPGADASVSPATDAVQIGEVAVSKGSRVVLRPSRRADAQDIFLAGRVGIVTAVLSDVDGQTHVAVVLEDDPASDLHEWYGRFWYFGPEELEPLVPQERS